MARDERVDWPHLQTARPEQHKRREIREHDDQQRPVDPRSVSAAQPQTVRAERQPRRQVAERVLAREREHGPRLRIEVMRLEDGIALQRVGVDQSWWQAMEFE